MLIERFIYLLLLPVGFIAALRFRGHKYFYYLYFLAAGEAALRLISKFIIHVSTPAFFSIILWGLCLSIPGIKRINKFLIAVVLLVPLLHFEFDVLTYLLIFSSVYVFIIYYFFEEFIEEIKSSGQIRIFIALFILEASYNLFRVILSYENIFMLVKLNAIMMSVNLALVAGIIYAGPNRKIMLKSRQQIADAKDKPHEETHSPVINVDSPEIPSNELVFNTSNLNHGLTRSEIRILDYLARGLTNLEIADHCHLSKKKTVENHLQHIREKLYMNSMHEVRKFAKNNLEEKPSAKK